MQIHLLSARQIFQSELRVEGSREDNQLVKCKNTGLYLLLYIPNDYKE